MMTAPYDPRGGAHERNARGHRVITGFSNPTIKAARQLRDKKHRRAAGLFLAEGLRILSEAQDAGALPQTLFYAGEMADHPRAQKLITATIAAGGDVIETTPDILSKLSGKDNAQTLIGLYADRLVPLEQIDRLRAPIWIVVQAMRDPGNLGTTMRTADAVGAGGVILIDDCVDPFSVETVRASMGALFTIDVAAARWEQFLPWLRSASGQLIGTSLQTDMDYQTPVYHRPAFLLVGNESQGLPDDYAAACDLLVKMPMAGRADSLNASVATAVMAYELVNQFRRKG